MISRAMLSLLWASVILAACGNASAPATAAALATPLPPLEPSQPASALQVVIVPSELIIGPNRFAVGLFDPSGHMLLDAETHFRYFDLSNPNSPVVESEADAERLATPDNSTAIFAHERDFDRAGDWGMEVEARFPDGATAIKRVAFQVLADSATLIPGEKVPDLQTPTAADV